MSKLSFRSRALDASKPLPIYRSDEITDSADCSLINRTVPQMPTGMEKEEEAEHHLQKAISGGSIIPTPEVFVIADAEYENMCPKDYKQPRQLIHMQPFNMDSEILDYDMDSDDEIWVNSQAGKLELTVAKFEEIMDRLEKNSGQTVATLQEAKALIKEDDDLIQAVYDYWLNKKLKLPSTTSLIPQVKTEARGGMPLTSPYIAFRRRTEKMQTRKNRKNDETSYEKMLKLKRDLQRAVTLLEMIKRREKSKREGLRLTLEIFEKRYQAGDFSGQIMAEALSSRPQRPAFAPLLPNSLWSKDDNLINAITRKEKRPYKKRKPKVPKGLNGTTASGSSGFPYHISHGLDYDDTHFLSSGEDSPATAMLSDDDEDDEGQYAFQRRKDCTYHAPRDSSGWNWEEQGDKKFRFFPTSISNPNGPGYKFVGYCRRRVGRGGRVILDRMNYRSNDDFWRSVGFEVFDSAAPKAQPSKPGFAFERNGLRPQLSGMLSRPFLLPATSHDRTSSAEQSLLHFRPRTPEHSIEETAPTSDDDLEMEDSYIEEEEPAEKKPNLGTHLGAVVAAGERPLMFETKLLMDDPLICKPTYTAESTETLLLDQPSSELSNAFYLLQCETHDFSDAAMSDLGVTEFQLDNPWIPPSSSSINFPGSSGGDWSSRNGPTSSSDFQKSAIGSNQPVNIADKPGVRTSGASEVVRTLSMANALEDEGVQTVVGSGELNFVVNKLSSDEESKRKNFVDKDDKENKEKSKSFRSSSSSNNGSGGSGGGSSSGGSVVDSVTENGDSGSNSVADSLSSSVDRGTAQSEESSASRTPINNNVINVNSSRGSGTFQYVVDSGLNTVVNGDSLDASGSSLLAKGMVVSDANNSSATSNKSRANGLQLVNMKSYAGSPEKLCHIVT